MIKYHCTKCNSAFALDKEHLEMTEGGKIFFRCEICNRVIVLTDKQDVDSMVDQFLLTTDELKYLTHLVDKQINKVTGAYKQLNQTKMKLDVQMELAKEREL